MSSLIEGPTLKRILATILFVYCFLCIILGGAGREGFAAHSSLQAIAAIGIAMLVATWPSDETLKGLITPIAVLLGIILLCLIQLVPLPVDVWQQLPSRNLATDGYSVLGLEPPSLPLSLDPDATLASIGYVFTPLFILLLCIRVGAQLLSSVVPALICVAALASVSLGIAQVLSDYDLYLYAFTSRDLPVGFFSNINHQASFLLMAIPFACHSTIKLSSRASTNDKRVAVFILGVIILGGLVLGVLMAQSIAGYFLLLPTLLLSFFAFERSFITLKLIVSLLCGLMLTLALLMSGVGSFTLEGSDIAFNQSEVSRHTIWQITWEAISEHWVFGTGVGTYESVIPLYENADTVQSTWVARAHNDYLQIFMEAGLLGGVMILFASIWFVTVSLRVWKKRSNREFVKFKRVASGALVICALHSLVDYPGRTIALAVVISLCVAGLGLLDRDSKLEAPRSPKRQTENPKRFILRPIT